MVKPLNPVIFFLIFPNFSIFIDCENLVKKFLVLNPARRGTLETIMRDKWMNMGYEEEELRPYTEPAKDVRDERRILKLQVFGYTLQAIHESLECEKFDEIYGTYLLLKEAKKQQLQLQQQQQSAQQQQQVQGVQHHQEGSISSATAGVGGGGNVVTASTADNLPFNQSMGSTGQVCGRFFFGDFRRLELYKRNSYVDKKGLGI